jgi:hypothetical protein
LSTGSSSIFRASSFGFPLSIFFFFTYWGLQVVVAMFQGWCPGLKRLRYPDSIHHYNVGMQMCCVGVSTPQQ